MCVRDDRRAGLHAGERAACNGDCTVCLMDVIDGRADLKPAKRWVSYSRLEEALLLNYGWMNIKAMDEGCKLARRQ